MSNAIGIGIYTIGGEVCVGDYHVYPKTYAGSPEHAADYFSRCLCGKKRKITIVEEVDINPSKDKI